LPSRNQGADHLPERALELLRHHPQPREDAFRVEPLRVGQGHPPGSQEGRHDDGGAVRPPFVDRRLAHPGARGDGLDRGALQPLLDEKLVSGVEHRRLGRLAALSPAPLSFTRHADQSSLDRNGGSIYKRYVPFMKKYMRRGEA
jgi:hypothetical protein